MLSFLLFGHLSFALKSNPPSAFDAFTTGAQKIQTTYANRKGSKEFLGTKSPNKLVANGSFILMNPNIGEVVAYVNGQPIGSKDFIQTAARQTPRDGKTLNSRERREILDEMVVDELVFQAAFERKLYLEPKVKKVMINALLRDEVYSQIKSSDFKEHHLKAYFKKNRDQFRIPAKVQARRILIKITEDRSENAASAKAKRIHQKLIRKSSKSNFNRLAEKHSDGPFKRRGGDLGFMSRKGKPGVDTKVVDRAFKMTKGQISEPFKSKAGFNIVMLAEKRAAQKRSYSQMKGTVLRKLKNEKLKALFRKYRDNIKRGSVIKIDSDVLNNASLDTRRDRTIATVDGQPIGLQEWIASAKRKTPENGSSLSRSERKEILDELISDELVFRNAFDKQLYLDPKVKKVMINALIRDEIYSKIQSRDFNESDLKNYYHSNKEEDFITIPAKVQVLRILIEINEDRSENAASAKAKRIHQKLMSDSSKSNFKRLAEKHSDGPYRRRGGDIGFLGRKGKPGIDTEVIERAFNLSKDQISGPFKSKAGFNIIMLTEKREAHERSFSQVKGTLLRKLKNDRLKNLFGEYRDQLKRGASIQLRTDVIDGLRIKRRKKVKED